MEIRKLLEKSWSLPSKGERAVSRVTDVTLDHSSTKIQYKSCFLCVCVLGVSILGSYHKAIL